MIVATIRKLDGTYLDHGNFASEEAAMIWLSPRIDQGIYGQKHVPAQYQTVTVVIQEALLDEQGEEISPEVTEDHQELVKEEIPAAFTLELEDVSAQLEQEKINREAMEYLDSTDWMVIRAAERGEELSPEFKAERQAARNRIIK
jgi:hypothetical protein